LPLVMRRKQAKVHRFVTVVQMLQEGAEPMSVTQDGTGRIVVEDHVALLLQGGKTVVAEKDSQGAWKDTAVSTVD
jgi:hypothetical protein